MSEAPGYTTVARAAVARIEVKRSVFECTVEPASDEADARAVLERLRKQHWDARHHCSAFVLGPDGRLERSNDDGEPAGTAGAPMLDVLRGAGLTDVVSVVTRWFGGTLLGAGGLVRAYSDAVRAGLDAAGTRRFRQVLEVSVVLGAGDAGRVEADLRTRGWQILATTWAAEVVLTLGCPADRIEELSGLVAELTQGVGEVHPGAPRYVDWS